jgi:hypothetical protein
MGLSCPAIAKFASDEMNAMRSVIIGLCGWVVAAGAAELEVRVRLQDYANVPVVWLTKAQAVATGILENAGVRVSWADCSSNSGRLDTRCSIPSGPIDLHLRILSKEMAKRTHRTRHSMGYAMVSGRFPSTAWVFYHRAVELEAGKLGARAEILGGILAHEIGHLLLAENSHSGTGVLRARWEDQDLRMLACGRLMFTREQAARMALLVTERVHAVQTVAEFRGQSYDPQVRDGHSPPDGAVDEGTWLNSRTQAQNQ